MQKGTHTKRSPQEPRPCCTLPAAREICQDVYSALFPVLRNLLVGLGRSEEDAYDLIGDVFSTMYHKINTGQWQCQVKTEGECRGDCMRHYVMKVVRARANDFNLYKKEVIWPEEYWEIQSDDHSFESDYEQKQELDEQIALLRDLVTNLSPKEVKLVLKRYFGEELDADSSGDKEYIESYDELAKWMNISKENAQVINSRAIKKLSKMMENRSLYR